MSAHPLTDERQKQRNSNFSLTVPETDCGEEDSKTAKPDDIVTFAPPEVLKTIALSPKLLDHIGELEIQDGFTDELGRKIDKAVQALLPDYNTATHSWEHAKQRYGWTAIELLVTCLEDPAIKDGTKFLGYMAHQWQSKINLKPNLKRISDAIATLDRKEVRDLEIAVLKERMPLLVKAGIAESEIGSWFRQAEITEIEDQLIVTLPNSFIAGRVKENYLKQLQRHCTKTIRIEQKPGKS